MRYTNYIDLAKLQLYLLATCVACESSKRNYYFALNADVFCLVAVGVTQYTKQ